MYLKMSICTVAIMTAILGCAPPDRPSVENINHTSNESNQQPTAQARLHSVKRPNHIVIVIEENHSYSEIAGNPKAPYINGLMHLGANFTNYHGVEHPSEPNYLDLFSGENQGVTDDSCPHTFTGANLATELSVAGLNFGGYCEDLPSVGYKGCSNNPALWHFHGSYARKHNPWVNFTNVSDQINMPFTSFPKNLSELPTVSFVIPNLEHDMHDGSIQAADMWLMQNIGPYREWAKTHNSLLIVTWDEDDNSVDNHVPTFFVGPMIRSGTYDDNVNHFNLLRTIEEVYRLKNLGKSAVSAPILGIWR